MTRRKSSYPLLAQAETLLIYGIFLFLTGLSQICITISHRYIIEKTLHKNPNLNIFHFLPITFNITDIHLWFIYPSAAFTIIPFLFCILYTIFKRQTTTIFICISSLISFICSSVYVGLLIVHTLEYWQAISAYRLKNFRLTTTLTTATTTISSKHVILPIDDQATFINLALLITFTLALVQALLSLIGSVISCLWSPCCITTWSTYKPILTNSHYVQTTPHRNETPQTSTLRSIKRQQQHQNHHHSETHRFLTTNGHQETMLNGYLHKNSPIRSHYDDV